jgi:hypothetical protein
MIDHFADRLEELDAGIRKVLPHGWGNPQAILYTIQYLTAQAALVGNALVSSVLVCLLLVH